MQKSLFENFTFSQLTLREISWLNMTVSLILALSFKVSVFSSPEPEAHKVDLLIYFSDRFNTYTNTSTITRNVLHSYSPISLTLPVDLA